MRPTSVLSAAVIVWLLAPGPARAAFIKWKYAWAGDPSIVYSDASKTSYLTLTEQPGLSDASGSTDIVATNLKTFSDADPDHQATFTDKPYTLTLYILDVQSGQSGTLQFGGLLNGVVSAFSADVKNQFTGATSGSLLLGTSFYQVQMTTYTPPGPPGEDAQGAIGAHAQVTVTQILKTPEPSSLLLALLGSPLVGYRAWRRRRA
jgi:hypothetical protein